MGLIRIAKKEARFDFRGRTESSNPLFRGFGEEDEDETEQYDEAVLVRMNTRDADELARGFPKEAEELFSYHAVIVDDLEADFFKTSQQALLEEFVSRRGGGFLMLVAWSPSEKEIMLARLSAECFQFTYTLGEKAILLNIVGS